MNTTRRLVRVWHRLWWGQQRATALHLAALQPWQDDPATARRW